MATVTLCNSAHSASAKARTDADAFNSPFEEIEIHRGKLHVQAGQPLAANAVSDVLDHLAKDFHWLW